MILAIDPGNIESGVVLLDDNLKPVEYGKWNNENVRQELRRNIKKYGYTLHIAIEMIASYGMAVGQSVFETCIWIGRFKEMAEQYNMNVTYIYRKDEKMNLCHSMKAKDSNIVQALIDRFAPNTPNKGKGSKKEPGWFYGFKKDIWQAYAVGVTYYDMYLEGLENGSR
ncbi:hypothetical protein PMY38_13730 [Clostridium tertium]|uniref:hypothetical protein n=1 Tax=Clostridium TaxID=1485 RepID=UPI0023302C86|nr:MULTISPECIES: hypothetical protein [Clostridium]MDB1956363.1 hypothetical protein [Clostridium tertium]MDB1959659.1 hypothetical protein [Clostridium tertium]MDB1961545.1 hypothetical protein [Clostridium tertium]MDB1967277.1 hypothetical protein [Clostridium tertium]MDU2683799.1 hypothetical protein [Clostridium sp.]